MSLTQQIDSMLEQVDRELSTPQGLCLVCLEPSTREFCCPAHRLMLWRSRHGLTGKVWREFGELEDVSE
jgi:hypothetical protein